MTDDWQTRLTQKLEPVLREADPRPQISAYHDMPYAIFRYPPEDEFAVRKQLTLLRTRLEQSGKRVTVVSLAECMTAALDAKGLDAAALAEAEKSVGLDDDDRDGPRSAQRVRAARRPRCRTHPRATPIRSATSSSSFGPERSSPSTEPRRCSSSSRARCTFPPSSSTRASSTAPPACASWASWTPSTTTDRRSSRNEPDMTANDHQGPLRDRHRAEHRRGHQGRPDRRAARPRGARRVRRHRLHPLALPHDPRALRGDAEQAARGHRRLGVRLLRLRQVELRQVPRAGAREPVARGRRRCRSARSAHRRRRDHRAAQDDRRAHPDPRGHLRRLGRPRHPKRQPDDHRDHVPALPAEPRLRPRPRPLRARDHARAAGPARRVQGEVRGDLREGLGRREGSDRDRHAAGEPRHARARPADVRHGRQLARLRQEPRGHHAGPPRRALQGADEPAGSRASRSSSSSTRSGSSSRATCRRCSTSRRSCRASVALAAGACGSSSRRRRS